MENPILAELEELLQPTLPHCYKKDHSLYTLSSAAKRCNCPVEDLMEQVMAGKFERFAQTILTDTGKYPDGRECLYESAVFRLTKPQLRSILDKNGDTIDLDPGLNGWLWSCPPRQVRVEINDLLVALPNCDLSDSDNSRKHDIDAYLGQNRDLPVNEKVRWLREFANMNNQEIGDLLNIGTDHPRCKSRKTTVQALYRSNFNDETWKKMHPDKKTKK